MKVTAWNNGKHLPTGGGYGIAIKRADRDRYFGRGWNNVKLQLSGRSENVELNISESFWDKCPELRSKYVGIWLRENRKAPWRKGRPPTMTMECVRGNKFRIFRLRVAPDS